jgi:hypothetical protein
MLLLRTVAAYTAVALLTVSCGNDDDDAETATEPAAEDESYDTDVATEPNPGEGSDDANFAKEPPPEEGPVDVGCFDNYPIRLLVTTDLPAEVPYLNRVAACTTSAEDVTLIANRSNTVWTISTTSGDTGVNFGPLPEHNDNELLDLQLELFRDAAPEFSLPLLLPESYVVVDVEPISVKWTLEPGLSAMWLTQERFVDHFRDAALKNAPSDVAQNDQNVDFDEAQDVLEDVAQDQVIELLSGNSLRRKAVLTLLGRRLHRGRKGWAGTRRA